MKPIIAFFLTLFLSSYTFAQHQTNELNKNTFNEKLIEEYVSQIINVEEDSQRLRLNKELKALLNRELRQKGAFSYPFKQIKSMSILCPADSAFRLFNWSIPMSNGTYNYECFMLQRDENGETTISQFSPILADTLDIKLEKLKGNKSKWPQALYYEIITKETYNRKYYTLLAWDGHNRLTKRKWIEVLWFDHNGELQMGAPIFKQERKEQLLRPVFRYSAQHAMKMRYNPFKDRIEFDFLAPESSHLEGIYEYYFPDVTQDAFRWNNNYWEYEKLISNEENSKKDKKRIEKNKKKIILKDQIIYKSN